MAIPSFLAEEHIAGTAVRRLKERGVRIQSVQDLALRGSPDSILLGYCAKERLCMVTRDADFLRIVKKEKIGHAGILFLTRTLSIRELTKEIEQIALFYSKEDLENRVLFLPIH